MLPQHNALRNYNSTYHHAGENSVSVQDENRQLAAQNLTRISVSDAGLPKTELWGILYMERSNTLR